MKNVVLLLLFMGCLFYGNSSNAQSYYEATWTHNSVTYHALVMFNDDNDVTIRARYKVDSLYKVAEYAAKASTVTVDDGRICYYIDGYDAKVVYGDATRGYNADNFLFYKDANGEWDLPYAIDDAEIDKEGIEERIGPVTSWEELDPAEAFTQKFVFNYFDKDEPLYNVLLSYNSDNVVDVAGVNGSGSTTTDGEWKVFMSKGTGYGEQTWRTRYEFPKDDIKELWGQSKHITDLSYGNGVWMVSMSENSGYGLQSWKYGASWPNEWIDEHWTNGQKITELTYGNGQWALVMSKGSGYTDQQYIVSKSWPQEWLNTHWRDGSYSITSLAYGAGHWAVVVSKVPGNPGQRIRAGAEFPGTAVAESWKEEYDVSSMAYGDEWVVILTKGNDLTQSYDEGSSFPKDFVKGKWDDGYAISEAIFTYVEPEGNHILNFTGTASSSGVSNNTIANTHASTTNTTTPSISAVPKLHLVVVANTIVPDIGSSCVVDRDNILQEFDDISDGLGIEIKKHVIDGQDLSKANVRSTINGLSPGSNDIVVFAYSGHGYRWSDQVSTYPNMAMYYSRYESPSNSNSYNLQEVYDLIVSKGARLNIVLGDCCNNDIGVTNRVGAGSIASRSFTRGVHSI